MIRRATPGKMPRFSKAHIEHTMQSGFLAIFPSTPTAGLIEDRIARTWAEK